jgi:hypothetical protein
LPSSKSTAFFRCESGVSKFSLFIRILDGGSGDGRSLAVSRGDGLGEETLDSWLYVAGFVGGKGEGRRRAVSGDSVGDMAGEVVFDDSDVDLTGVSGFILVASGLSSTDGDSPGFTDISVRLDFLVGDSDFGESKCGSATAVFVGDSRKNCDRRFISNLRGEEG